MDDDGSADYTTIQDALNNAAHGDTIIVNPGTYPEDKRIDVNVSVTIKGASGYPSVGGFNLYMRSRVEGLTITKGIDFDRGGTECTVRNNRFEGCGVSMGSSYMYGNQTIMNNLFTGSGAGVSTYDSWHNKIIGNTFQNCNVGIHFGWGIGGHIVTGNTFKNCGIGIHLIDDAATIYNNYFYNDVNLQIDEGGSCTLNTTKTAGENIIDGPYIAGNYWATPSGDGFSQTHSDADGDGIAEEPYYMNEVNIDYLPLVTPRKEPDPVLPVANFRANTTHGNAPLSVLFTDLSENAISRSWDVNNDGIEDSSEASFVYIYTSTGTYTVNLTVSNANGTVSKTTLIDVERKSSGGSSSGGGGGGGSPEPARNVEVKELSQVFITNGKEVKFDFSKNATCVMYVSFDSKKTAGKTTTIVEQLKGKSALVSELPEGEVYKSFNVWVGNSGFATSKNIEKPVIGFKVEKTWVQDKKIDPNSIALNRYSDKKWEQLPVNLSGEEDEFLYFTSEVPGFSSFAITGKAKGTSAEDTANSEPEQEIRLADEDMKSIGEEGDQRAAQGEDIKAPGFEIVYGIICLSAIFLYKRK